MRRALFAASVATLAAACGDGPARSARALEGDCQTCHAAAAQEHADSRHATAATSPVFVALREAAQARWKAGEFCDGCHRPVGGTEAGLGCLTCHASVGNLGRGDGALLFEPEGPVRAARAEGRAPHAVGVTGFIASSDLCGTCHDVVGPGPFRESPFAHWAESPAAERNQTCQSCHLGPEPGQPRDEARPAQHRPVGLLGGSDAQVQAMLSSALELEAERADLDAARQRVTVTVRSLAEGHHVPDGASFLRALWLDVEHVGGRTATVDELGRVTGDPRWLSARLLSGDREVVMPTDADRAESRALPPGAPRVEVFEVPPGAARACLRFRRYRGDLLEALGLPPSLGGTTVVITCVEVS